MKMDFLQTEGRERGKRIWMDGSDEEDSPLRNVRARITLPLLP